MTDGENNSQPTFRAYEGMDARPDLEPNVAVRKTAVDFENEANAADAETGLPPKGEDESWKDRYSNLRSFSAKKENKYKSELKELNDRLHSLENSLVEAKKQTGGFIPTSENELNDWSRQNPDAYKIIRSIAAKEKESEIAALKQEIEFLKSDSSEKEAETARKLLEAKHPDVNDLAQDQVFWAWIDSKPKWYKDVLTKSFNVDEADEVLKVYKLEHGLAGKAKPRVDNRLAAAMDVSTRGTMPQIDPNMNYLFKESDIKKMTDRQYETKAPEITAAYMAGKVLLDVTNRTSMRG